MNFSLPGEGGGYVAPPDPHTDPLGGPPPPSSLGMEQYEGPDGVVYPHGEFMELKNLMVDGGDRFGVSAVAFDRQEELLWMGNAGGHMTSYYSLELQKYTSFQAHESEEIRAIFSVDTCVYSLTKDSLRCVSKFGRPQHKHVSENLYDMQCMIDTGPTKLLMGGHQPIVVEYDIETRQETQQVSVAEPGCAILRHSNNYICAGDTSGKVTLYGPNTLSVEHVLQAHSGTLSDFDVHGNQLITCGFSNRYWLVG